MIVSFITLVGPAYDAQGQTPTWPSISTEPFASGFTDPVTITHAGDGSGRLFVVERRGVIWIVDGAGSVNSEPFLDIQALVRVNGSEEGLLGLAFPLDYENTGRFYVYYTNNDSDNVLARYHLTSDPDVADPASEQILITFDHPTYENHNGGSLAFGPDGYLYVGTGDGGGGGDPFDNAQDLGSLLGKLLRLDVEFLSSPASTSSHVEPAALGDFQLWLPFIARDGTPYLIPPDNPFAGPTAGLDEIWAYGLRNPWRFSFDRDTGNLFIGDVGQASWEEVDFQDSGSSGGINYGWDIMEGTHCYNASSCNMTGLTLPIAEYASTGDCSVTGGYVYRGSAEPALEGIYFFGDFCSGIIRGLQPDNGAWAMTELLDTSFQISTFGENEAGELFFTDYGPGDVHRLVDME